MSDYSKRKLPVTNMGITTIITVFIVLSLVTFASLSYVNARNDNSLSQQVALHNDAYYQACNEANQQIAEISSSLSNIYRNDSEVTYMDIPAEYNYQYPIGDSHCLYVTIVPTVTKDTNMGSSSPYEYLQNHMLSAYSITRFEVVTTSSWDGDSNVLPVQTFEQK